MGNEFSLTWITLNSNNQLSFGTWSAESRDLFNVCDGCASQLFHIFKVI